MDTPVFDFVRNYKASDMSRFHMPGHKGQLFLGCEDADITEIEGADVLGMACGIIAESQANASRLFGTGATFYSTEGSSLCIKAMVAAVLMDARCQKKSGREYILAARNVHRSFVDACALFGVEAEFIMPGNGRNICGCRISPVDVEKYLENKDEKDYPIAVYITSPDYLGNIACIGEIAKACDRHGLPLIVDNAHGAYLAFLDESCHPVRLGAAMCCDSAHKTLPVLTGGAYLHISSRYKQRYEKAAKQALMVAGSTSPSYLVIQSLDFCNRYLSEGYKRKLSCCIDEIGDIKKYMKECGIPAEDSEPLKIVINTAEAGYTGIETAAEMRKYKIVCEYADMQYVVLMATPCNSQEDFGRIKKWSRNTFISRHKKNRLKFPEVYMGQPDRRMTIREAVFAPSEVISTEDCAGRICAAETVSCPPAIPIAVCGEVIDENMKELFKLYNIKEVCVVQDGVI